MTTEEVRDLMRRTCQSAGGAKAWALANGISPSYASDVLLGRRDPAGKILAALGLEKDVDFRPAATAASAAK